MHTLRSAACTELVKFFVVKAVSKSFRLSWNAYRLWAGKRYNGYPGGQEETSVICSFAKGLHPFWLFKRREKPCKKALDRREHRRLPRWERIRTRTVELLTSRINSENEKEVEFTGFSIAFHPPQRMHSSPKV